MAKDFNSYFTFIYVSLTEYEKKVLYAIIKYPTANDREIAEKAEVKQSTVAAIRKRLRKEGYFTTVAIPMLQNVGAELLIFTHASFNPVIPLSKRLEITEKKIEAFEEIVFSLGEEDKGFSIGFSKNYTDIARINDIRTKTFGKLGLLEKEYPDIAVFPFKISKTYRFFDFSHPLRETFGIDDNDNRIDNFFKIDEKNLSKNEKKLLCSIVKNPELNSKQLSSMLGLTRHTIGRLKRKFLNEGYLKIINIPRFQNYRNGDFSTVARDAIFRVDKKGMHAVKGIRISDNMQRILENIEMLSKQQKQIFWWEVETPVFSPYAMVKDVSITTP